MFNKTLALGTALFSFGLLTGIAGTAIWAFSKQDDHATRMIAWNKSQNSELLEGLVILSDEENLDLFRGLATQALRSNILDLDLYLASGTLAAGERHAIESTLRGIAHRREQLRLGAYAAEQSEISNRIESILASYDPPAR